MRRLLALSLLLVPTFVFAEGALYLLPENGTYSTGETFDVRIVSNTGGSLIHAVEGELRFNNAALSIERISTDGSILKSWSTEPTFSNELGSILFSGWTGTTYSGSDGLLLTVTFKALRNMTGNVRFLSGAMLAADGQGSNIIADMKGGVYEISPREIEPTAPETVSDVRSAPQSPPEQPAFLEYEDLVEVGEHIIVKGKTSPYSTVHISLQRGSETPILSNVESTSDGTFTFVSEAVAAGVYRLFAEAEKEGLTSTLSETIAISARSIGFAAAAQSGVDLMTFALPFVALIVLAGLGSGYLIHRHKVEKMSRELHLAHLREEDREV